MRLTHAGEPVARSRTDDEGRFEFPARLRAGTVVAVTTGTDLVVEPESLELDELPAEELVFVAREQPAPFDGVHRTTTGDCRFAALASDTRPSALTVRYRDWKFWDGQVEADGRFDDSEFCLNAYFEPPGR